MKKIDKFKWTAVAAVSAVVLATVVLAFIAPIYLITLWLGFCAGYIEIRALTLYTKELQYEKNMLATDPEVKTEEVTAEPHQEVPEEKPAEESNPVTEGKKTRKRVAAKKKTK